MSLISMAQLLKNIANAYRTLTGTTALIKYGELAGKIQNVDGMIVLEKNSKGFPTAIDATRILPIDTYLNDSYLYRGFTTRAVPGSMFSSGGGQSTYIYVTHFILPQNLNGIGESAFYNTLLVADDIDLSEVECIGTAAFKLCRALHLVNLSLPNIKVIGQTAFGGATSATVDTQHIVAGNVTLGSIGHAVTSIGANAFQYQTGITGITVYTENGQSTDLSNAPWGAENATINYINA